MLAKDIATEFRTEIDDTDTADPLWSDTEVIRYMNLAIEEVAEKTLCINEATDTSITELTVTAASEWVPYNEVILEFDPQQAYSRGRLRQSHSCAGLAERKRYSETIYLRPPGRKPAGLPNTGGERHAGSVCETPAPSVRRDYGHQFYVGRGSGDSGDVPPQAGRVYDAPRILEERCGVLRPRPSEYLAIDVGRRNA
jgi:hypothetical protein